MLVAVGLVIDGGYAYSQQRGSQNGADATATAGALVIAKNLPFRALGQSLPQGDGDVLAAVEAARTANAIDNTYSAYYTDLNGNLIAGDGSVVGSTAGAARVGGGTLPPAAWGVRVLADRSFDTFFVKLVGFNSFRATTTATAVAGYVENAGAGNVLPITIPLNMIFCQNNGDFQTVEPPTRWPLNKPVVLPLCKGNASGNVGWLDWYPPAGGTNELVDAILNPSNPAIDVPSWQLVTSTGNVNSQNVEDAINTYAGKTVLIPFFDNACTLPNAASNSACPPDSGPGNGQNNWYHMPLFFGLKLDAPQAAFIAGQNGDECGQEWSGAGCLKGTIVNFVGPNVTVGAGTGTTDDAMSAVGVQLIK
jgi:hypothetical protein